MSPKTAKQNEDIRRNKRKQIMDTALELFAQRGFHATSISDIASKAGISKGLMYNYFDSKEVLLKEIMTEGMDSLLESFDPNRDGILTRDEMILFLNELFRLMQADPLYWKLYFAIALNPHVYSEIVDVMFDKWQMFFRLIKEYFERKGVRNADSEAQFFVAMLDGIYLNALYQKDFPVKEALRIIIEKFV